MATELYNRGRLLVHRYANGSGDRYPTRLEILADFMGVSIGCPEDARELAAALVQWADEAEASDRRYGAP